MTDRQKVEQEPCRCVTCGQCHGNGYVPSEWQVSGFDTEPCEDCNGGIVHVCDRCQVLEDMDSDEAKRA